MFPGEIITHWSEGGLKPVYEIKYTIQFSF